MYFTDRPNKKKNKIKKWGNYFIMFECDGMRFICEFDLSFEHDSFSSRLLQIYIFKKLDLNFDFRLFKLIIINLVHFNQFRYIYI
jgi:hypothetical protein